MPEYRFIGGGHATKPTSGYAERISRQTWAQFEATIRQMYDRGSTRGEILCALEEQCGFRPSTGQLRDQMTRWGLCSQRKASELRTTKEKSLINNGSTIKSPELLSLSQFAAVLIPKLVSVTDDQLWEHWLKRSDSPLKLETVKEMDILGNVLFSGRRYAAAFEVFFLLYNQLVESRAFCKCITTCMLLETVMNCSRSASNDLQVARATEVVSRHWNLVETDFRKCDCLDKHFAANIGARYRAMKLFGFKPGHQIYPLGPVIRELCCEWPIDDWQLGPDRMEILSRYYDILRTPAFCSFYEQEMVWYGKGSAISEQSATESIIYWYLTSKLRDCPPCLSVSTSTIPIITLSSHETIAFVVALLSSTPVSLGSNQLLENEAKDQLMKWLKILINDNDAWLQATFQHWKRTALRMRNHGVGLRSDTEIEAEKAVQGDVFNRMLGLDSLAAVAGRMTKLQQRAKDNGQSCSTFWNVFDSNPKIWDNIIHIRHESTREKSLAQGCEKTTLSQPITPSYIMELDPPLNPSPHPSNYSSYCSFRSTHLRSHMLAGKSVDNAISSPGAKLGQSLGFASKSSSLSRSQLYDPTISPPLRASDHKSYDFFQATYLRTISKGSSPLEDDVLLPDFHGSPSFHALSEIDEILVI